MKNSRFYFGLIGSLSFLLIIKLPFTFFNKWLDEDQVTLFKLIVVGSAILVISYWVRKKYVNIRYWSIYNESIKYYPLVLLPIFFPGLVGVSNEQNPSLVSGLFIFSILIKAICEEVVFRGLIFGKMMLLRPDKLNQNALLSSSFFALLHFANLPGNDLIDIGSQVIYAFYMGLLFAVLMIKTKNVWLVGIVHAVVNYILSSKSDPVEYEANSYRIYLFSDYIIQFAKISVLFSPVLVMYFLLQKSIKTPVQMR